MKTKVLTILFLLLVLTSILGLSYASWLFTGKQKDFNTLGSKCFELTMINESEGITLFKAYPISDEEGLDTTGYTFTIKNTCNTYATYQVNLEELLTKEKRLSGEYIKVSVNDGSPISLKNLEEQIGHIEEADKSYGLTSGSLAPEEEATYTIKLWMDESTPPLEETMNAIFLSKVSIEAGYIEEGKLENTIQIVATSKTEEFSQEKEAFEIVGTSENYNLIEYSFDNTHWTRIENPNKEVSILEEITKEGSYTIYLKDEVGNIQEIPITTNKLDQTIPEISIEVQDKQETIELEIELIDEKSGIKNYTITTSKEEPEEWISYEGKITYTVTENNIYYIWAEDQVGNKTYQVYSASTIDIKAPEVTIKNTLIDWGTTDTIQIKATDDVIGISGISISKEEDVYYWEVVENSLSYETEKEITENGTCYISLKDGYEHITTKSIVIDKIDDILPSIESLSVSSEWGTSNEITGTFVDKESGLSGYQITTEKIEPSEYLSISGSSYEFTYTVNENGIYYIWVKDIVGNLYQTEIEVSKVDAVAPTAMISANVNKNNIIISADGSFDNESGIANYQYSKDNKTWYTSTSNSYTFTGLSDGTYTVYVKVTDNVGRTSSVVSANITVVNTLYLFNEGSIYGTTSTWNAFSNSVDYMSIGNTIHYADTSASYYGGSVIGFNSAVDLSKYSKINVIYNVSSLSDVSSDLPFYLKVYVLSSSDYETNLYQSELDDLKKAKVTKSFYQIGDYTTSLNVSSLSGNYNILVLVHSLQYVTGKLTLDISSISLTP